MDRLKKNERKVEALRRRFAEREAALLRANPDALTLAAGGGGVPPTAVVAADGELGWRVTGRVCTVLLRTVCALV